jgi:hypothetical protein
MAALDEGLGGVSMGELAIERVPSLAEHERLFIEALRECGIEMPTGEQAVEILLRYNLELIACGAIRPYDGLMVVVDKLYHPYISNVSPARYVGDQRGLEHLIGAFFSYDELRFRPDEVSFEDLYGDAALCALDRSVQRLAQEWLCHQSDTMSTAAAPPAGM